MIKNIIYIVILNIIFISCKKEETCNPNSNLQANLTAEQQQKLIARVAQLSTK